MNQKRNKDPEPLGKLPPQAVELEEAVLGALLTDKTAIDQIADILSPDMFYKDANHTIYKHILKIYADGDPIDLFMLMASLKQSAELEEVGGMYYITGMTDRVVSAANIEYHARIIMEKHIQRQLIANAADVMEKCYSGTEDVFDTISRSEIQRDELMNKVITNKETPNGDLFNETVKELMVNSVDGITGVPTGLTQLDKMTGGIQPSDLVIIAARPSMGKSSLALSIALNATIDFKKPGAFFSLEMSNRQLMKKEISIKAKVPLYRIVKKKLNPEDHSAINSVYQTIKDAPIYWDDTPSLSVFEFRAKARRLKRKYGIEWIVIDYLQLMTAAGMQNKNGNREQEISTISRTLKGVAKELDIPVIALSQLSRAVESRPDKRPMLSDLRESGAIEQDADVVMFLYRPEYYKISQYEDGSPTSGMAEIIVAKNRNGECDDVVVQFVKDTTEFRDVEEFPSIPAKESNIHFHEPKTNDDQFSGLYPNDDFDDNPF